MSSKSDLVVVHTYGSRQEADIAVSALDAAGIGAMIQADSAGDLYRAAAWAGAGFQVIVRAEDSADAHAILEVPARPVPE